MFPLTPSNTAQTLGLGPSARPGRRATASAVIVGAAAIALLAFAHISANSAENSSRMAQEHHACAVVLGLDPSDAAMTAASGASIEACPNGIKRDWFRPAEAHVPRRGSSPARHLSQCAC
jgi:hypothetical protein